MILSKKATLCKLSGFIDFFKPIIQGVPTRFLILCWATMTSSLMAPKKLWYIYIQYMRKFDLITINEKKLTVKIVKI